MWKMTVMDVDDELIPFAANNPRVVNSRFLAVKRPQRLPVCVLSACRTLRVIKQEQVPAVLSWADLFYGIHITMHHGHRVERTPR